MSIEVRLSIDDSKRLNEYGLSYLLSQLKGRLKWEINASAANTAFKGKNSIGSMTYIGKGAQMANVQIGRFCSIASDVFIGGGEHYINHLSSHPFTIGGGKFFDCNDNLFYQKIKGPPLYSKIKKTLIGNDVWIGQGAYISQGVVIGDGAVIGARSVVTKNVAPYTIVAGVPAKEIRNRFEPQVITRLLETEWWKYDFSSISKAMDYTDINQCCDVLAEAINSKTLEIYQPKKYSITNIANEVVLTNVN